ncbi:MlaD family protein [uncultured Prevotella sp.]|uniref:MlaD family protein n=1 Tax=uncultured Prevotella sp. TaxID=159272 RepID=UPI0026159AAF|nr:MlaD family protein [uncultured Prevotella sp.]
MKFFTKEIKIALVAICGLVILFFGMNYLKGLNLFSSANKYYISFKNISGLASSSPIYADGYKVGVVKSIKYDYNKSGEIIVEADIDQELRIPKGSSAEIVSDMLGNVKVNLLLATNPRERVMPGETIQGGINDGALGKMKDMVPVVMGMLPKLDSIVTSLNILLADPSIAQSLHNVNTITGNLTVTTTRLNTLLAGLNRSVPGVISRADSTLDNANLLAKKLNSIDVAGTMAKVDATLANVEEFTSQLNSNQGTLGLLMRDPSLYNNLNSTMQSADSLLIDLKAHPKRYVHFSLFGRKDN